VVSSFRDFVMKKVMGRKSNAPQRRQQITWALFDCLASKGHEKATIKEIAARAQLPPGVIHYYFKSKDEIISTLAQVIVEKYSHKLETRLSKKNPKEERIRSAVDFIVDELIFDATLNRVFYNLIQMAIERAELRDVMRQMFREYRDRLARFLSEVGVKSRDDTLGAAIVAMAEGFSLQLMVQPDAVSRDAVHQTILQLLGPLHQVPKMEEEKV
jgi:AcrR family transcriptional regulator